MSQGGIIANLHQLSPYLSADILLAFAEHPLATKTAVIDLALANPESLGRAGLIAKIAEEKGLNASEITQLNSAALTANTGRSVLEEQLHNNYADMQYIGQKLLRISMASEEINEQDIEEQLTAQGDLMSDYALVDFYWETGDLTSAWGQLNEIQINKLKTPLLIEQFNDYQNLKLLHESAIDDNRDWSQLQNTEVANLQLIAEDQPGLAFAQARQVLNTYYDFNYLKLPALPDLLKKEQEDGTKNIQSNVGNTSIESSLDTTSKFAELSFSITPNPAHYKVRFSFDWPNNSTTYADLKILDTNGREVFSERIFNHQSNLYWLPDTQLKGGVYYCFLELSGHTIQPQKLILIK